MNQDYNGYTKRKLIEMAKNQGISTSGAKQDIIDRLKNHDAKSRPTPSKKITQEEYDRQVAILSEEMELEEMERAMKEKQRRLRKLRLDAQLAGEEDSEAEISSEEEEEETEEKEHVAGNQPRSVSRMIKMQLSLNSLVFRNHHCLSSVEIHSITISS